MQICHRTRNKINQPRISRHTSEIGFKNAPNLSNELIPEKNISAVNRVIDTSVVIGFLKIINLKADVKGIIIAGKIRSFGLGLI